MVTAEERKAHIDSLIAMDPIFITITRTTLVEQDGAYTTYESTLPEQTARIFRKEPPAEVIAELGREFRTQFELLVPAEGDIKADSENEDVFTHPMYGELKVIKAIPSIVQGTVCGYQATVEKVK